MQALLIVHDLYTSYLILNCPPVDTIPQDLKELGAPVELAYVGVNWENVEAAVWVMNKSGSMLKVIPADGVNESDMVVPTPKILFSLDEYRRRGF